MVITLVGEKLAKPGLEFIYYGPGEPCKTCRLARVCIGNLEPGRRYKVIKVRNIEHPCPLHEGKVRVVEVVEPAIEVLMEPRYAIAGSKLTLRFVDCNDPEKLDLVRPEGLFEGDTVKIIEILGDVECNGRKFKLVKVMREKE
ncbi:UPF0179 family protein [Pyrococcus abyssi]|uniref:UPF0179 protein PYRAB06360 n=1 Tax=Pyrococcus abyssi (strain GE5 / Orsay) TaxID=272844 RepID=Y636_PYRAB|nr:UPF0179 family protein [Pyrococcus abyssi]Q8J2Y1.1 RecName: Full=UPF0179 protein PYRAB06360 [Pyrococcus abyssi GE5]CAD55658.1 Conserved hypothetical protein [Pyrococcus abyssi GE5]CCE70078.1 TPA: hypothetical protein PAB1908 [Pyrococcus abyssi GE5]